MLDRIRIVLVNTSHPGNIGAAARAMKTMGLSDLALVEPKRFPDEEATSRASGAEDVLERARVCDSLDEALVGCTLAIGTTARDRSISTPPLLPHEAAERALQRCADGQRVAVVFGRERSGLTNEEIDRCQLRLNIPANPDYSSLNLGAAVQVVSYALRAASLQAEPAPTPVAEERHPLDEVAETQVLESFYGHLEKVLTELDFLSQSNPTLIMRRLRCLYDRAEPTVRELNILRGALSATENLMKSPDQRAVENSDECD